MVGARSLHAALLLLVLAAAIHAAAISVIAGNNVSTFIRLDTDGIQLSSVWTESTSCGKSWRWAILG